MEYLHRLRLSASILVAALWLVASMGLVARPASGQPVDDPDQSWGRLYLPASDGLLGLRYGMDRSTVDVILRGRGLVVRTASGDEQIRFEGEVLGERADVVASFVSGGREGGEDRLARIEVRWRYDGALRAPQRIFESLEELLDKRYGPAVSREVAAWSSISVGDGSRGSVHVGPETEAMLKISGVRKDLYRVELRLEFPPWAAHL